jgi:type II secretory pathway pseudopilin PulG
VLLSGTQSSTALGAVIGLEEVRIPRNQGGFTIIELIIIIVVIGILAGLAIPRYLDLRRTASDGVARGVLGALRSQNTLVFSQRILGRTTARYTMRFIANSMSTGLRGISWNAGTNRFTMTVGGNTYTFTINPTPGAPTTLGRITAGGGTFATW